MISIVKFHRRHLTPTYVDWLNNPDLMRFSEQRHRRHTLDSCRAYWRSIKHPDRFWAIERDGQHVGNLTASVDAHNATADLAILVGDGGANGVGTAAWSKACDTLFAEGIRKITAGTMDCNTAMIRIAEKTGMRLEGRRVGQFVVDGDLHDCLLFGMFAPTADTQ